VTDRIPCIHHVLIGIPAGGEDLGRAFYGGLLGFAEVAKPANLASRGGCWFQTGNLQLHLGVDQDFAPATKAHVAFEVDDLDAVRNRLASSGIAIVVDEPLPGYERFYVADPFGNRVELLTPRP
jgi:catechol 2,3-dioxygenase-like lactoylglutathione lyase family enzyme